MEPRLAAADHYDAALDTVEALRQQHHTMTDNYLYVISQALLGILRALMLRAERD